MTTHALDIGNAIHAIRCPQGTIRVYPYRGTQFRAYMWVSGKQISGKPTRHVVSAVTALVEKLQGKKVMCKASPIAIQCLHGTIRVYPYRGTQFRAYISMSGARIAGKPTGHVDSAVANLLCLICLTRLRNLRLLKTKPHRLALKRVRFSTKADGQIATATRVCMRT